MPQPTAFEQFQHFLREMFQYDNNDLDFGLFKVLRLKRNYIEQFINGDGEQDLRQIVQRELAAIRSAESEDEREMLGRYLDELGRKTKEAWAALLPEPNDADKQARLKQAVEALEEQDKLAATLQRLERWLATQKVSLSHLEAQLYNYLLNFFELYYQNGDFGYNSRASNAFKVPYEADYDGSDTLFHWKHKDSYYIKTGASFPEVKLDVLGQKVVFRLQAGGDEGAETTAQNNNKESDIKHYRLAGIEQEPSADGSNAWVLRFTLAKASTPKAEIYPQLWQAAFASTANAPADITPYLLEGAENKSVFNDLGKDHDKAEGGQIKGINQLRLNQDKYLEAIAKQPAFRALGSNGDKRVEALKQDDTAQALYAIDKALNRFYVGQDADYFIHKDLHGFLTREKDRFIKNVIFSDLDTLLARQVEPATLIIARGFNAVAARIIEFLDVLETFQRNLFTLKKKVVETHWLISVGKIDAGFYPRLIANPRLIGYWASEFKCAVTSVDDVVAQPTLVVDTSLFDSKAERELIEEIIGSFDRLDEQTDGLLIHSENWQALNLLQDKFRERIQCIYIDPPYNTGGDGFLYKDSFRHSSWASMMEDRLALAKCFLSASGISLVSIDHNERTNLEPVMAGVFGQENRIGEIIWNNVTDNNPTRIACEHEYVESYAVDLKRVESEWKSPLSAVKRVLMNLGDDLVALHSDTPELRSAYAAWYRENKIFLGAMEGYKFIDAGGVYAGSRSVHNPGKEGYRYDVPYQGDASRPCKQPLMGYRFPEETMKRLLSEGRILFGADENKIIELKVYAHEYEDKLSSVLQLDGRAGPNEIRAIFGNERTFKNPKAVGLLESMFPFAVKDGDLVFDFFAGSGTTGHAVISLNKTDSAKRRFLLVDAGEHLGSIAKPRIARVMRSANWNDGSPLDNDGWQGLVKVQRLEQYEDVIANLETAWNNTALPEGIPVSYLFRPEQNCIQLTLDLKRPFDNRIRVGRAGEERTIDLLESWSYLQGYWQRSRRVFNEAGRRYECLETECGTLVVLRGITEPEDDSVALKTIVERYVDTDEGGNTTARLRRLEVNYWANLVSIEAALSGLPCTIINAQDFDRGAEWV